MILIAKTLASIICLIPVFVAEEAALSQNVHSFIFPLLLLGAFILYPVWRAKDIKELLFIMLKLLAIYVASLGVSFFLLIGSCLAVISAPNSSENVITIIYLLSLVAPFLFIWLVLYKKSDEKETSQQNNTMAPIPVKVPKPENIAATLPQPAPPPSVYESDPINKANPVSGLEPLLETILSGNEAELQKLLQNPAVDVNIVHKPTGNTPLCVCALNGYENMAKLLLAHPKTDVSIANKNGKTAHALAVDNGHDGIAKLIETRN